MSVVSFRQDIKGQCIALVRSTKNEGKLKGNRHMALIGRSLAAKLQHSSNMCSTVPCSLQTTHMYECVMPPVQIVIGK